MRHNVEHIVKYIVNKRVSLIVAAVVVLLIAVFLFARRTPTQGPDLTGAENNANGVIARPSLTVTLSKVQSANWSISLTANGSIAAWQESIIGTELNGVRLVELLVQVGDQVKRGEMLARFSTDMLNTEVAQQRAALADAEANLAEAQSNARPALQLKESGALSIQQINQYATVRNIASAKVAAAKAGLQAATLHLQHARILASEDGIISARSATLGAVAQAGQELFRIIRQGRLEWRAEMSAEESSRIHVGQAVTIFAFDGSPLKGKVRMVTPTVDPQTRKTLVYVDLIDSASDNQRKSVVAGMFAKGDFLLGESNALSVPASAVVMRDGHASVFMLEKDNKVKQVRVIQGRMQQGRIEIVSGLASNASVIDSGAGFLADGDTVRVVTESKLKTAIKAAPGQPSGK
jgi:HlyD family secretion protein